MRIPGASILENEPVYITRPLSSREWKDVTSSPSKRKST